MANGNLEDGKLLNSTSKSSENMPVITDNGASAIKKMFDATEYVNVQFSQECHGHKIDIWEKEDWTYDIYIDWTYIDSTHEKRIFIWYSICIKKQDERWQRYKGIDLDGTTRDVYKRYEINQHKIMFSPNPNWLLYEVYVDWIKRWITFTDKWIKDIPFIIWPNLYYRIGQWRLKRFDQINLENNDWIKKLQNVTDIFNINNKPLLIYADKWDKTVEYNGKKFWPYTKILDMNRNIMHVWVIIGVMPVNNEPWFTDSDWHLCFIWILPNWKEVLIYEDSEESLHISEEFDHIDIETIKQITNLKN